MTPGSSYDTSRSNYNVAALWIGVATKAFNRNTVCQLNNTTAPSNITAPGGGNAPLGTQTAIAWDCEAEEIDLNNQMTADYEATMHGITIAMKNAAVPGASPARNYEPTADSTISSSPEVRRPT